MVCWGAITDLFELTQWIQKCLFDSKVKFWESGYSCHLLTIELISERGYEVTFLLLLRLGDGGQGGAVGEKQNDHLNVILFKVEEAKTSGCSEGKYLLSTSLLFPKLSSYLSWSRKITCWVYFMLPVYSWVWNHPLDHERLAYQRLNPWRW